ncbi:olfactory receptor 1F1-like [Polyodon spathula]|uniref:olfactory receptor 1F1-like n=1 Tax=Polyodon spathula TaxID=7913 RepID=UPI001B7DB245|nr:olfactory receptor 1F1-like [Polyodon spathula]
MNTQQTTMTAVLNGSIVRPPGFYIIGFSSLPNVNYYLIFLGIVYIVTVLANILLITVIWAERCLHTPKYIAVVNLAVIDVCYSSSMIPKMIDIFLMNSHFMPYNICLTQMFFVFTFSSLESISLSILAYDRLVAICFPLRQHAINTNSRMLIIIATAWVVIVSLTGFSVVIMNQLSFCKSITIYSYFCDYAPVFRLACNDYSLHWLTAVTFSMVLIFGPLSFIIVSYVCIIRAMLKIKSVDGRFKAFKTCTEHLTLVTIFYLPTLILYILGFFIFAVEVDTRMLNLSLSACIPPLLNPIVYTLKTKEIMNRIHILLKMVKISPKP